MDVDHIFTISDVGTKCKSKSELYTVLTTEGGLYLPPKRDWTQKFLRQLMIGQKKVLHNDDVKVINVAQINGLRVPQILLFARAKMDIDKYLPDYDYEKEPNRSWLANVVNSLIGKKFQDHIALIVKKQQKEKLKNQNLAIQALPQFVNIFKKSDAVSTTKRKSHFVMRPPKPPKTLQGKEYIEEIKYEYENRITKLNDEMDYLKWQLNEFEQSEFETSKNRDKLAKLYEKGLINSDGELKE